MFLSGIETPLVDPLVIFAQEVQCFFSQCAVKQLTAGSMIIGKFRSGFQSERSLIVEFGINILEQIAAFLPKINNWSVCDSFCITLKAAGENPAEFWDFLQPCILSGEEFTVRFAIVMLLDYYITPEYIDRLFPIFDGISHEGYYVKMAVAWAVSMCYVKFPDKTESYLGR